MAVRTNILAVVACWLVGCGPQLGLQAAGANATSLARRALAMAATCRADGRVTVAELKMFGVQDAGGMRPLTSAEAAAADADGDGTIREDELAALFARAEVRDVAAAATMCPGPPPGTGG
ncbi:MAG: hypothetical protein VKS61_07570 [Candidatus Sericytochromatia bacterium]|nr:hypothetical protein [Candidatus Sericytochromatia bacterium]